MNSTQQSQCIQFSADIAGSGVRVSFYIQTFILVLLVDRSYEDAGNSLWTFIATSFGLTIAALMQVKLSGLSLLEGILVSQLCWFANIGTFVALASYSRSKGEDNLVKVAAVLQGYFSMILTVVMWSYADRFPWSQCDYKFVFMFGWELPALGSGRTVALVFAALTIFVYTVVTYVECRIWWKSYNRPPATEEYDLEMSPKTSDRHRRGSSVSAHTSRHIHNKSITNFRGKRSKRHTNWLGVEVDPKLLGVILLQAVIVTYFIVTTELIIARNNGIPQGGFGFGQVLALTVVIPSVIALYRAIRKNHVAKLQEKQRKKEENVRANDQSYLAHYNMRHPSGSVPPPSPQRQLTVPGEDALRPPSSGGLAPTVLERGTSLLSVSTANL